MTNDSPGRDALAAFIAQHKLDNTALGTLLDESRYSAGRIVRGIRPPTLEQAAKIELLTGIPCIAWVDPSVGVAQLRHAAQFQPGKAKAARKPKAAR